MGTAESCISLIRGSFGKTDQLIKAGLNAYIFRATSAGYAAIAVFKTASALFCTIANIMGLKSQFLNVIHKTK